MKGPELVLYKKENKKQDKLVQISALGDLPPKNNKSEETHYMDLNRSANDENNWVVLKCAKTLDGFYNVVLVRSSGQAKSNVVTKDRVCVTCMFENGEITYVKINDVKGTGAKAKNEIVEAVKAHILQQEKEEDLLDGLNNDD